MGDCLRQVNHLGMKPTGQVDSAFYPPWDGKLSISLHDNGECSTVAASLGSG